VTLQSHKFKYVGLPYDFLIVLKRSLECKEVWYAWRLPFWRTSFYYSNIL